MRLIGYVILGLVTSALQNEGLDLVAKWFSNFMLVNRSWVDDQIKICNLPE